MNGFLDTRATASGTDSTPPMAIESTSSHKVIATPDSW